MRSYVAKKSHWYLLDMEQNKTCNVPLSAWFGFLERTAFDVGVIPSNCRNQV